MKLPAIFKNRNVRFKTVGELVTEYGNNWMDVMGNISPEEAIETINYFQGKKVFSFLVTSCTEKGTMFSYTKMNLFGCLDMLTTKNKSKYDSQGNVLKPGMIVRVESLNEISAIKAFLPWCYQNKPGTLVKILKVFYPCDYLKRDSRFKNELIDNICIITELRNPAYLLNMPTPRNVNKSHFNIETPCTFEPAVRVCCVNDVERKFYYKTI